MFQIRSLCFLVLMFAGSGAAASVELQGIHANAVPAMVTMSRMPLRVLVEKGEFEGGRLIRATPVESVKKFGKRELWLVRPAKEFKGVSEIIGYLNSIGLEPAGYRELLEFAIQVPNFLKNGEVVYALGSSASLQSGVVAWQYFGMKDGKRFLSDVVDGEGWPIKSYYLAKRKLAK